MLFDSALYVCSCLNKDCKFNSQLGTFETNVDGGEPENAWPQTSLSATHLDFFDIFKSEISSGLSESQLG